MRGEPSGTMEKGKIVENFSAAAASYDANAPAQLKAAEILSRRLFQIRESIPPGDILEIGCGTGLFSQRLIERIGRKDAKPRRIVLTDASDAMLTATRQRLEQHQHAYLKQLREGDRLEYHCLDAGQIAAGALLPVSGGEHKSAGFALIASSFALQWLSDPCAVIRQLMELLAPGGVLLLSVPGAESFPEWRESCVRAGSPYTGNRLPSAEELGAVAAGCGATSFIESEAVPVEYPSARAFFLSLRRSGAHTRTGVEAPADTEIGKGGDSSESTGRRSGKPLPSANVFAVSRHWDAVAGDKTRATFQMVTASFQLTGSRFVVCDDIVEAGEAAGCVQGAPVANGGKVAAEPSPPSHLIHPAARGRGHGG